MLPQQVWPAVLQDFQSHLPSLQINTIITLILPYKKLRLRKKSLYSPTPLAPDYPDISKLHGTVLSRGGGASDSHPCCAAAAQPVWGRGAQPAQLESKCRAQLLRSRTGWHRHPRSPSRPDSPSDTRGEAALTHGSPWRSPQRLWKPGGQ